MKEIKVVYRFEDEYEYNNYLIDLQRVKNDSKTLDIFNTQLRTILKYGDSTCGLAKALNAEDDALVALAERLQDFLCAVGGVE